MPSAIPTQMMKSGRTRRARPNDTPNWTGRRWVESHAPKEYRNSDLGLHARHAVEHLERIEREVGEHVPSWKGVPRSRRGSPMHDRPCEAR